MVSDEIMVVKSSSPFFSVVITTYNRAPLLKRALNSLIAQTEKDWEAIVIDDGSTDDTTIQIAPYLKKNHNIQYIKGECRGATGAKNAGMALCSGKYITFLDSDDEYDQAHLATRKEIIEKNPSVDFLHGGVKITGSPLVPDRYDYGKMINLSECVVGGSFFIRKQLALSVGGFTEMPLGSDADLFERVSKMNVEVIKVELPTYVYHRETLNSITNNLSGTVVY
ncbi:MAG: glycosyltransferase family A protein [Ginsengibacter sp.]